MKIEDAIKSKNMSLGSRTSINIMYTDNVIQEKSYEIFKNFDLSSQQYNVLRILRGQKGKPANLYTIQERMIHKMSNTTRLVDKLILKGLVSRIICEKNRRKVEITITEKGLELLNEMDTIVENNNKELIKNLTIEEAETLNFLLDKLRG
ncbi:MarR family winged helix-turn-helix transcriptional regulator [Zhouia sp. PK063]|uniref:MarR family winged helix-turn-helix transcriptional regulator n=1 Tax=Zhouia sp. PK063 TaxID=3373602 RepID=UPI00378B02F7